MAGFFASLYCHLVAWLIPNPPLSRSVFLLHAGIFVAWIPLVILANRTRPNPARGNLDHLFAVLPGWLRLAAGVLFGYAIVNFLWFLHLTGPYPKGHVPFRIEVRGFSGHWMLFYGIAAIGFVALDRLAQQAKLGDSEPRP
jgi:hypothetical protein